MGRQVVWNPEMRIMTNPNSENPSTRAAYASDPRENSLTARGNRLDKTSDERSPHDLLGR